MISRREFLQAALAANVLGVTAGLGWAKAAARQSLTLEDLLKFDGHGNVTLVHFADLHAQLMPIYYREPNLNYGSGGVDDKPPHITGRDFLSHFNIKTGSPEAYALSSDDFAALAGSYGKMGGLDRVASIIEAIRAERGDKVLLLDGGDSWQGSYTSFQTKGGDMIEALKPLNVDAMTGHWEFTFGAERVKELIEGAGTAFLGGNVFDATWDEPALEPTAYFEKGGIKIAVIGQAFPYTAIANPKWLMPDWSFGIREKTVQSNIDKARANGAQLVVLLSHNGFDVDAKLAMRVKGLDVILSAHTHDAMPELIKARETLIVASGSNGKFVSRLDLDVSGNGVRGFRFKLIPIFSDVIEPNKAMAAHIQKIRAPYKKELSRVIGKTDRLLYRRGSFNGSYDDLICAALMEVRDAEISLSPGFRWGTSLLQDEDITVEALFNACAINYPATYRTEMNGAALKAILEDVADNLFHPDPYYCQGGDMVRVGGIGFDIRPSEKIGSRISNLVLLKNGTPIEAGKTYSVAGWASVNEGVSGPPITEVVERFLAQGDFSLLDGISRIKVV